MPRYLLSSQSVFDIVKKQNLPAQRWLAAAGARGIYEEDICISAVTPMTVIWEIDQEIEHARREKRENEPTVATLQIMRANAQKFFADYAKDGRIIPMGHEIAERWGWLLDSRLTYRDEDGSAFEIGSARKIELATAIVGRDNLPFVYIDQAQPAHANVPGLVVEDPLKIVADSTP